MIELARPARVVTPRNASQVVEIVQQAREMRTPLVPKSSAGTSFRGTSIPSTGGATVVDLSGMKRILHVDRKNRVVMFEPGVTFSELADAVKKEGLRLNMPLLPRRTKSVLASLLEREPVLMPKYHWDIADPLGCLEVVFGTGEVFRTGAAAGSGSIEEQWAAGGAQKEAAGPSSASWYRIIQGAQGTMGIATWASARCELLPRLEEPFLARSDRLEPLLEAVHWLIRLRLVNECLILNRTNLGMMLALDPAGFHKVKDGLPPWLLFFNVAAYDFLPEERLGCQVADIYDLMQKVGLPVERNVEKAKADEFLRLIKGPSPEPYWKLRHSGNCQDILFLSMLERIPALVNCMFEMANTAGYPAPELGVYIQPLVQGSNYHCELNLFYNAADMAESTRVKDLTGRATRALLNQGAFFSRPYGEQARMIMNQDAASVGALKKVKAIVDPLNIMNPGKLCF